nr:hypothetical protein Iba_chr12aCG14810 [Ipomoea batatas]GMD63877.1 hypothetical protein Iba_chr12bCG19070 [Ipomoea batatas]GMD68798.1 hypothetical protein Iba_chr12dCG12700 [Ipomoea batatas]GMD70853.1 hypothetical protein Iba_chr12eCG10350 [Ipomoea batatas]
MRKEAAGGSAICSMEVAVAEDDRGGSRLKTHDRSGSGDTNVSSSQVPSGTISMVVQGVRCFDKIRSWRPASIATALTVQLLTSDGLNSNAVQLLLLFSCFAYLCWCLPFNAHNLRDLDAVRGQFGKGNGEHAVLQPGLHGVKVGVLRKPESAPELAVNPLLPVPMISFFLLLLLPLSADPQHPVLLHLDLQLLLLNPRHI